MQVTYSNCSSVDAHFRLTAVMDCCHSGTGMDLPYIFNSETLLLQPEAPRIVVLISFKFVAVSVRRNTRSEHVHLYVLNVRLSCVFWTSSQNSLWEMSSYLVAVWTVKRQQVALCWETLMHNRYHNNFMEWAKQCWGNVERFYSGSHRKSKSVFLVRCYLFLTIRQIMYSMNRVLYSSCINFSQVPQLSSSRYKWVKLSYCFKTVWSESNVLLIIVYNVQMQ